MNKIEERLAGFVDLRGRTMFSQEQRNGASQQLMWSFGSGYAGITAMSKSENGSNEFVRVSLSMDMFTSIMQNIISLSEKAGDEKEHMDVLVKGLASAKDPSDKVITWGLDPEKGVWICVSTPGGIREKFHLLPKTWNTIRNGEGVEMTRVAVSKFFTRGYIKMIMDEMISLDALYEANIGSSNSGSGAAPAPGGGTEMKEEDVPF